MLPVGKNPFTVKSATEGLVFELRCVEVLPTPNEELPYGREWMTEDERDAEGGGSHIWAQVVEVVVPIQDTHGDPEDADFPMMEFEAMRFFSKLGDRMCVRFPKEGSDATPYVYNGEIEVDVEVVRPKV